MTTEGWKSITVGFHPRIQFGHGCCTHGSSQEPVGGSQSGEVKGPILGHQGIDEKLRASSAICEVIISEFPLQRRGDRIGHNSFHVWLRQIHIPHNLQKCLGLRHFTQQMKRAQESSLADQFRDILQKPEMRNSMEMVYSKSQTGNEGIFHRQRMHCGQGTHVLLGSAQTFFIPQHENVCASIHQNNCIHLVCGHDPPICCCQGSGSCPFKREEWN